MTAGNSATISLVPGVIKDRSAVANTTQVLGITTVRYVVPTAGSTGTSGSTGSAQGSTSAKGVLATTGTTPDFLTPTLLLLFGFLLIAFSKRKTFAKQ